MNKTITNSLMLLLQSTFPNESVEVSPLQRNQNKFDRIRKNINNYITNRNFSINEKIDKIAMFEYDIDNHENVIRSIVNKKLFKTKIKLSHDFDNYSKILFKSARSAVLGREKIIHLLLNINYKACMNYILYLRDNDKFYTISKIIMCFELDVYEQRKDKLINFLILNKGYINKNDSRFLLKYCSTVLELTQEKKLMGKINM